MCRRITVRCNCLLYDSRGMSLGADPQSCAQRNTRNFNAVEVVETLGVNHGHLVVADPRKYGWFEMAFFRWIIVEERVPAVGVPTNGASRLDKDCVRDALRPLADGAHMLSDLIALR